MLREIPFGSDGDFSHDRFEVVYETELGNKLGNLVSRVAAMLSKYCDASYDVCKVDNNLELDSYIADLAFENYLSDIMRRAEELNAAIEETKPWELQKTDPSKVREFLSGIASEIVVLADYLAPFLPDTTPKIKQIFADGKVDSSVGILFPRLEK